MSQEDSVFGDQENNTQRRTLLSHARRRF